LVVVAAHEENQAQQPKPHGVVFRFFVVISV